MESKPLICFYRDCLDNREHTWHCKLMGVWEHVLMRDLCWTASLFLYWFYSLPSANILANTSLFLLFCYTLNAKLVHFVKLVCWYWRLINVCIFNMANGCFELIGKNYITLICYSHMQAMKYVIRSVIVLFFDPILWYPDIADFDNLAYSSSANMMRNVCVIAT